MGEPGVTVKCAHGEYVPIGYKMTFDSKGRAIDAAILLDERAGAFSVTYELLEKVSP